MNRREFLNNALFHAGWMAAVGVAPAGAKPGAESRIGATTVSFRARFPSTRPKGVAAVEPDLNLLDVPALFAERLGIRNVEVWSKHFGEGTPAYGEKLRAAAAKAGARIINVQMDEPPFDLSSPDAAKREACLAKTKEWMAIAAACGSPSMRANVGGGKNETFDPPLTLESFRRLAEHGASVGVRVLVENHGGHSMGDGVVTSIVKAVDSPWCRALPDFGNMPGEVTMDQRIAFLSSMFPLADLISAKAMEFDKNYRHITYDLGACVRAAEAGGFKGIYSVECWAPNYFPPDPFRAVTSAAREIGSNL